MLTVIIDYDSGNLHSASKAFERMAQETNAGEVRVSADPASRHQGLGNISKTRSIGYYGTKVMFKL